MVCSLNETLNNAVCTQIKTLTTEVCKLYKLLSYEQVIKIDSIARELLAFTRPYSLYPTTSLVYYLSKFKEKTQINGWHCLWLHNKVRLIRHSFLTDKKGIKTIAYNHKDKKLYKEVFQQIEAACKERNACKLKQLFLQYTFNVNTENSLGLVKAACAKDHKEIIRAFIRAGLDISCFDRDEVTPNMLHQLLGLGLMIRNSETLRMIMSTDRYDLACVLFMHGYDDFSIDRKLTAPTASISFECLETARNSSAVEVFSDTLGDFFKSILVLKNIPKGVLKIVAVYHGASPLECGDLKTQLHDHVMKSLIEKGIVKLNPKDQDICAVRQSFWHHIREACLITRISLIASALI